jgi:hypothetical protein
MGDQLVARPLPVHKHRKRHTHTQTPNVRALSEIWTHGPGFRASEDCACLKLCIDCARLPREAMFVAFPRKVDTKLPRAARRGNMVAEVCSHLVMVVTRSQIFYPEDGGDTFLRNVGSHKIYTAPYPRTRNFSSVSHLSNDFSHSSTFLLYFINSLYLFSCQETLSSIQNLSACTASLTTGSLNVIIG